MPSQLFTVDNIKSEYRALAKIWHPDRSQSNESLYIMGKINALYKEGSTLIKANKFYEKERLQGYPTDFKKTSESKVNQTPKASAQHKEKNNSRRSTSKRTIELVKTSGQTVRFKYIKRLMIELGFIYLSKTYILLEVTKLKRKIFVDAVEKVSSLDHRFFQIQIPHIVDTFETKTHGYIVIKKEKGIEPIISLELISNFLKPLAARKICEGIFYDLTALKHMGLTTAGIQKDLILIDVFNGQIHNYGLYFYLHAFHEDLIRAPQSVSKALHSIKPMDHESKLINLTKKMILNFHIDGGCQYDDFQDWLNQLNQHSLEETLAESQVFNRAIASVTNHGFSLEKYYMSLSSM